MLTNQAKLTVFLKLSHSFTHKPSLMLVLLPGRLCSHLSSQPTPASCLRHPGTSYLLESSSHHSIPSLFYSPQVYPNTSHLWDELLTNLAVSPPNITSHLRAELYFAFSAQQQNHYRHHQHGCHNNHRHYHHRHTHKLLNSAHYVSKDVFTAFDIVIHLLFPSNQ